MESNDINALLEGLPDGLVVVDSQFTVLHANPAAGRLAGMEWPPRVEAPNLLARFPGPDRSRIEPLLTKLFVGDTSPVVFTATMRGVDELMVPVECAARKIHLAGGDALVVSLRDVSERRSGESEQLRAQRMQTLGNLAGGIAHDLNNVLTPVSMAMGILRDRMNDPLSQRAIDTVSKSVQRGSELISQLLIFARGGEDSTRGIVSIKDACNELERILSETLPPAINLLVESRNLSAQVTSTQVHQILMNLCINARDAMPAGGMLVVRGMEVVYDESQAAAIPGASAGRWVCLEVKDTGCGMTPEVLEHIWDPFFSTKASGKGTGLGLRTVFQILKDAGGFVTVESQPDAGSTFRVHLPPAQSAPAQPVMATDVPPQGAGQRILICEDDAAVREMLSSALECFGYQVEQAADGMEAVSIYSLSMESIDCVITDVIMPFVDGFQLVDTVRRTTPDVPVILITGSASTEIQDKAAERNLKLLRKPFATETLLRELADTLAPGG